MEREQWFSYKLTSRPDALVEARDRFDVWLVAQGIDSNTVEDLVVVLSELGANAMTAAAGADASIEVRAWHDDSALVLEVENDARSAVSGVIFHSDTDPLRGSGQGLLIVTAYTDSVEVIPPQEERGLLVRCRKAV